MTTFEMSRWMFTRLSPRQIAAAGWVRTDKTKGKLRARWRHESGWTLSHCGHPTALWPWALYNPAGEMICTGAVHAPAFDPANGTAWPNLASAMMFVATLPSP